MPVKTPAKKPLKKTTAVISAREEVSQRRGYDSPVRRRQIAETRERILSVAAKLVQASPTWDWKNLNSRTVADLSGVGLSTVKRSFPTERSLRDAVIQRLMNESGVEFDTLNLDEFGDFVRKVYDYLARFAAQPPPPPGISDPSFASMDQLRRNAMLAAVVRDTPDWPARESEYAAALLDVIWNQPSYERLTISWGLDPTVSAQALAWLAELLVAAIKEGKRPQIK